MQGVSCNWGCAEAGTTVYMYYVRVTVSLFWCVVVFVVTVCGWLSLWVVLYGWGVLPNWKTTNLSWQGKKKSNSPTWKLDLDFVTASLQTTAGVAKGVSRFSGTGLLAVLS